MANRDNDDTTAEELYTMGTTAIGAAIGSVAVEDSPILGMAAGAIIGLAVGVKTSKKAIKAARTGNVLPPGVKNAAKLLKG